jgi:glycosyltransferase involved in cell wall biosynthesis
MPQAIEQNVLIFNFVMDVQDQVLSHQSEVVVNLAAHFGRVDVITGRIGLCSSPPNVSVKSSDWVPGQNLRNGLKFIFCLIRQLKNGKPDVVFSHMTQVQSLLAGPFLMILGIRHVLWYAHTKNNFSLRICSLFVNQIVTSTNGSCPIKTKKVIAIGQSIRISDFLELEKREMNYFKLFTFGRFDPLKDIENLISSAAKLHEHDSRVSLLIVGSPSSQRFFDYARHVTMESQSFVDAGWLRFSSAIPRAQIFSAMRELGCFIHSYRGSLDKSLLEATLMRKPVLTVNSEYIQIFGSWSQDIYSDVTLVREYESLISLTPHEIGMELDRRIQLIIQNHSVESWYPRLVAILCGK